MNCQNERFGINPSELRAWLVLNSLRGVGPRTVLRLINRFGSAEGILRASERELASVEQVGDKTARAIIEREDALDAEAELAQARSLGVSIIPLSDSRYPLRLAEVYDPPLLLYVLGDANVLNNPALAVVGSRNATQLGRHITEKLSTELAARGLTIVSGLAAGVDAAAHTGAMSVTGGTTIAVLGCGVDIVYPPSNRQLYKEIPQHGAIVSEYALGTTPEAYYFPPRNRIISGLSLGVLVVEAQESSGALITARHASDQGRELFAVPGSINSPLSRGPHQLIKQGAKLVETVEDVMAELYPHMERMQARQGTEGIADDGAPVADAAERADLTPAETKILRAVIAEPQHFDSLCEYCGASAPEIAVLTTKLELLGLLRQLPGKFFTRI